VVCVMRSWIRSDGDRVPVSSRSRTSSKWPRTIYVIVVWTAHATRRTTSWNVGSLFPPARQKNIMVQEDQLSRQITNRMEKNRAGQREKRLS
jgi:hypothetical protein